MILRSLLIQVCLAVILDTPRMHFGNMGWLGLAWYTPQQFPAMTPKAFLTLHMCVCLFLGRSGLFGKRALYYIGHSCAIPGALRTHFSNTLRSNAKPHAKLLGIQRESTPVHWNPADIDPSSLKRAKIRKYFTSELMVWINPQRAYGSKPRFQKASLRGCIPCASRITKKSPCYVGLFLRTKGTWSFHVCTYSVCTHFSNTPRRPCASRITI